MRAISPVEDAESRQQKTKASGGSSVNERKPSVTGISQQQQPSSNKSKSHQDVQQTYVDVNSNANKSTGPLSGGSGGAGSRSGTMSPKSSSNNLTNIR